MFLFVRNYLHCYKEALKPNDNVRMALLTL